MHSLHDLLDTAQLFAVFTFHLSIFIETPDDDQLLIETRIV